MFGLFKKEEFKIVSPLDGELIPLAEVGDGVFSEKMMGDGFAVNPANGSVCAPMSGTAVTVFPTGHAVESLYAVLAAKGFFPIEQVIKEFSKFGSKFIGHPNNKLPGIEMNSGSLGHGLPVCVGMALAGKMDKRDYRVYTVMGDGELAEGSVWEGAMAAHQYQLDNLCAVVDRNRLQISGSTEDVMAQDSQEERWAAFGWHVISVNGNDYRELHAAFEEARATKGAPAVIIANTVKGCGSAVMENQASWHHKVPSPEEYAQIIKDFETRKEAALHE